MDVLSDVLQTIRISGSLLFRAEFCAPWNLAAPHTNEFAPLFIPNAKRMLLFHIIAEGSCWAVCDGLEPMKLDAGDIVVLPYGDAFALADEPAGEPEPVLPLLPPLPWDKVPVLRHGGNGEMTRILCGFLHADEVMLHPLFAGMAPMFRVRWTERQPHLQAVVGYALDEAASNRPGSSCLMTRITDMLFVEILRQYMEEQSDSALQPLAALRDPAVSRALAALHAEPQRDWTLAALAREAAVSRSVLAGRFTRLVGCPPMQYLTRWRIQLAAHRLREAELPAATVAAQVGYQSEYAFSRAFKRHVGEPPAAWQRRQKELERQAG